LEVTQNILFSTLASDLVQEHPHDMLIWKIETLSYPKHVLHIGKWFISRTPMWGAYLEDGNPNIQLHRPPHL